jgi:hypothetical protein
VPGLGDDKGDVVADPAHPVGRQGRKRVARTPARRAAAQARRRPAGRPSPIAASPRRSAPPVRRRRLALATCRSRGCGHAHRASAAHGRRLPRQHHVVDIAARRRATARGPRTEATGCPNANSPMIPPKSQTAQRNGLMMRTPSISRPWLMSSV